MLNLTTSWRLLPLHVSSTVRSFSSTPAAYAKRFPDIKGRMARLRQRILISSVLERRRQRAVLKRREQRLQFAQEEPAVKKLILDKYGRLPTKSVKSYQHTLRLLNAIPSNKAAIERAVRIKNNSTSQDPLNEMRTLMGQVGLKPEKLPFRVVHIAGTKGKGSVAAYTSAIFNKLREHKDPRVPQNVGTFMSPHLQDPRERILINGQPISAPEFMAYFSEVWDMLEANMVRALSKYSDEVAKRHNSRRTAFVLRNPPPAPVPPGVKLWNKPELIQWARSPEAKPFFFQFLTLLAFYIFAQKGVRTAVIEVGIGGAKDPTNVIPASKVAATVVTELGLDHTELLGPTIQDIAREKAGIFKKNVPAITSATLNGPLLVQLRKHAVEANARFMAVKETVEINGNSRPDRQATLGGDFQKHNRALAVVAARALLSTRNRLRTQKRRNHADHLADPKGKLRPLTADIKLHGANIPRRWRFAMQQAKLRGRCETFPDRVNPKVTWYLDGAHTSESLAETAKWFVNAAFSPSSTANSQVPQSSPKIVLVFNQAERDAVALLKTLTDALKTHLSALGRGSEMPIIDQAIFTTNELELKTRKHDETAEIEECEKNYPNTEIQEACCKAMEASGLAAQSRVEPYFRSIPAACHALAEENSAPVRVLVVGSFHLVGVALNTLRPLPRARGLPERLLGGELERFKERLRHETEERARVAQRERYRRMLAALNSPEAIRRRELEGLENERRMREEMRQRALRQIISGPAVHGEKKLAYPKNPFAR